MTSPNFIETELEGLRWIPFSNNYGGVIPPFAIILAETSSYDEDFGREILNCTISQTYGAQYSHYVNGPTPVKEGGKGVCTNMFPLPVLYDESDGPLDYGDTVGPRANSFKVFSRTGGFRVVGSPRNGVVLVESRPMLWMKVKNTTVPITKGTYGTGLKIMWGNEGSETEVSGQTVTAYNRYADIPLNSMGSIKLNDDTGNWEYQVANVCL